MKWVTILTHSSKYFESWITILCRIVEKKKRWRTILSHSAEKFESWISFLSQIVEKSMSPITNLCDSVEKFKKWLTFLSHINESFESWIRSSSHNIGKLWDEWHICISVSKFLRVEFKLSLTLSKNLWNE